MRTEIEIRIKIENLKNQMTQLKDEHQKEIAKSKENFNNNTPDQMAAISNFYQRRISILNDRIFALKWVLNENIDETLLS